MRIPPKPIRPVGGGVDLPMATDGPWRVWLVFLLTVAAAAVILGYFHDRFWWPPDDGAYAYVAERILAGDVLNRDVRDIHAGYINFVNAAALALFGMDLVSLRYPLAILTLLQAGLLFRLFAPLGALRAAVAAISMASLSFVQFLNPTPHWYCLFLFVAVIAVLSRRPPGSGLRLELVGFLLMLVLLFRQLSGVLVAIGVLAWLLAEARGPRGGSRQIVARLLVGTMIVGLAAYLAVKADPLAVLLFGIWPLGLLLWVGCVTALEDRAALIMLARLAIGGVLALLPLLGYHLAHGSLASWFEDTVLAAVALTELDFVRQASYGFFLLGGLRELLAFDGAAPVLNGIFWILLPLLAAMQGAAMWLALWRGGGRHGALHPLPFLAVFYPLVSVHFQIAIYLFYSAAISLAGLLWLAGSGRPVARTASLLLALLLSGIGLYWQAGQPLTRGAEGILRGDRVALVRSTLERASLWITPADEAFYAHAGGLVAAGVPAGSTLLAVPSDPSLNFLFARASPLRSFNTALGIRSDAELAAALERLAQRPPALVFYRAQDKYVTGAARIIMREIAARYDRIETREGVEVYRYRAAE